MNSLHNEFCVLTATVEELREVVSAFDEVFEPIRGSSVMDQIFAVPCPSGEPRTVRMALCGQMGHMSAAVRTGQLVVRHQPHIIMFVGTAASLKPDKIQVGDVVVPKKAVNRIYDKISEKGQPDYEARLGDAFKERIFEDQNALISDLATHNCSPDALAALARVRTASKDLKRGKAAGIDLDGKHYPLRDPGIFLDVDIFSCNMVVDSLSYRSFIIGLADASMRKVGVIDMESYGFFSALDAVRAQGVSTSTQGLMIRGVSDYAGRKAQSESLPEDWKSLAVRNAAIVTRDLIGELAKI